MAGARVYLVGSADDTPEERAPRFKPAIDALSHLGFDVTAPAATYPNAEPFEALRHVREGMAALQAAEFVAILPGAERCFEVDYALALGKDVVTLADLGVTTAA